MGLLAYPRKEGTVKYLVDLVKVEEMGVTTGGNRTRVEEYVQIAWGDEFELGLEVEEICGYEVVDTVGEVVGYIFLAPMEGT
jgi:hypothetical protein